eukprot:gnl/TRDRNA2_/TRDRNA2_174525_c2_seq3.p2 gnl/TRDRNA2_/TRDRNA2_174525_c2~~gnl/TRDRNA2_/TRDRNA2_174525_c2_seq3.p2  ORF type:complete len:102 (+),score=15.03 gnl/TRDRNA2_/TRDRNA2_174525_c2_seq3:25-330(+)
MMVQAGDNLFAALARAMKRALPAELKTQDLSSIAWVFATMGRSGESPFPAFARAIERRLGEFSIEQMANIAWAFVQVGRSDEELFAALARAVRRHVSEFDT